MDKLYIDTNNKNVTIELPQHGTVKVIVQNGKVIRTETTISQKLDSLTGKPEDIRYWLNANSCVLFLFERW